MTLRRIYIDTSVLGGCLDDEFEVPSRRLVDEIRQGRFLVLVSDLLLTELSGAPPEVRAVLAGIPLAHMERVGVTAEAERLRDAYVRAEIVGPSAGHDALHVALATIARADCIVSWNFRHIVHAEKAPRYNGINRGYGYPEVEIRAPWEVLHELD
jgi:predicted nucleic acid-binding protein